MKLAKQATGKWAKLNTDFKDRDLLVVLDEGTEQKGDFGPQTVFKVRCPNNEERLLTFNRTSQNHLIDAYGEETKEWVGKRILVWVREENVSGEFKDVIYLTAPDRNLKGEITQED